MFLETSLATFSYFLSLLAFSIFYFLFRCRLNFRCDCSEEASSCVRTPGGSAVCLHSVLVLLYSSPGVLRWC